MTSIFVDKLGIPIIDGQGNILFLTDQLEFKQRIFNIFSTQRGSEPFYPDYGFDIHSATILPPNARDQLLKMLATEALNVNAVQDLLAIKKIDAYIVSGTTGIISLDIMDIKGNEYKDTLGVTY